MTIGYDARIVKKSDFHKFPDGHLVTLVSKSPSGNFYLEDDAGWGQHVPPEEIEWLNEDESMATKKQASRTSERNPKNFRNGDVVKVSDKKGNDAMVFVKFGENYYNLTAGGQMKAFRYLPPGTKEIITNLSGMGKFFLMSEEELEEQAAKKPEDSTVGVLELTPEMVDDFEKWIQHAHSIPGTAYWQTDTTEEK